MPKLLETSRENAWGAVHEALPARWHVGPVTFDPGRRAWSVTARGPHPGRGKAPVAVSGAGDDETAALRDLDDRLRGVPRPRLAYIQGAARVVAPAHRTAPHDG